MTLFALAPVLLGVSAFVAMAVKDQSYTPSPVYTPVGEPSRRDAVVYYSRSGHSEAVAREIARLFTAPIARIASDYLLSFAGQGKALADATGKVLPAIEVEPIDLRPVQRVYLVSPTWLFRPATPLWAYVEQTDLTGKEVVLFTTGNSRFEQNEIDEFAKRVEARGGQLIRHIFIRRGRIYWQMSRKELLDAARAKVSEPSSFAAADGISRHGAKHLLHLSTDFLLDYRGEAF
ncbi:MAG: flavodoxin/nitric oxide synthase [Pseudomonadota bacterium]